MLLPLASGRERDGDRWLLELALRKERDVEWPVLGLA